MNKVRAKALKEAADLRKYRSSKHYRDSVERAKKNRAKELKRKHDDRSDSIKSVRKHFTDSLSVARKGRTDSLQALQKKRTAAAIAKKKYKESKRFTDSVNIVKRTRSDSIKRKQQIFKDSVSRIRKHDLDISKGIRKHEMDSMKAIRKKYTDSLTLVRKRRTDSLNKVRNIKGKNVKDKEKVSAEKKKLAFETMIKKKHEAYTNKDMLKKKWSPVRRLMQNGFTHYNYYYNANRKMEEAQANMLRAGPKENYDSILRMYAFDPDRDSSLIKGDMDTIIRKASLGIQIHDPRVKWSNDLFLLMGQAYYYKGNYTNAAISFQYIISTDEENKLKNMKNAPKGATSSIVEEEPGKFDFLKHKSVHNEAIYWLARTNIQQGKVENGQAVLSLLASDPNLPEEMVGKVAEGKAFSYLVDKNYDAACEQLQKLVDDKYSPEATRMRAAYLRAQLLQKDEKYLASIESYERCLEFFPKLDMDFACRKNIAYNILRAGKDVEDGMKPLKKVLNDGKYVTFYDQVYYVLGNLAVKSKRTEEAIKYLKMSATTPKASKKQKAISYAALGDVYYNSGAYNEAKNAYDSCTKYAGSNNTDQGVAAAIQKGKGLSEVSVPFNQIKDADSILALAEMSKKEQEAVAKRYIRDLEKRLQDSAKNAAEGAAPVVVTSDAEPGNDAANWYFSNPVLMQQGAADFKRKWGNRPLVDNWRRSSAITFASSGSGSGEDGSTNSDGTDEAPTNGLPSVESLVAKIPKTDAQKEAIRKNQQKAYIALAKAYLKQLDDYKNAESTLDTLDAKYPKHLYQEEDLYLRYQIAVRKNELDKAQSIATEFLKKFPTSILAENLKPKQEDKKAKTTADGKNVVAFYDDTYQKIIDHKYDSALTQIEQGIQNFDDPIFKKRFEIAKALCYSGMKKYDMADTLLDKYIAANPPSDSLTGWATSVKAYNADVRKNGVPSWYKRLLAEDSIRKLHPELADQIIAKQNEVKKPEPVKPVVVRPADVPLFFSYAPEEEHFCFIFLSSFDSRFPRMKQKIKRFDSTIGKTDVNIITDMYSVDETIVLIKGFKSAKEVKDYSDSLVASGVLLEYRPSEVKTISVSAKNYKKLFYDKDIERYVNYYDKNYIKH